MGSFTQAGRRISLIAILAAGILVGLIVRQTTGSSKVAVFSFLLYELGIVLLLPVRIGMNDPQFPAEALCAAGVYFYLRDSRSPRLLCLSALAFCVAGFYKQSVIAFPAAVGLDLILRSWRSWLIWMGAMLASLGALTALTIAVDGHYFFASLTGQRAYSLLDGFKNIHNYLALAQLPLLVAIAWCIFSRRRCRPVILLLVLTHALSFYFAGGDGVDLNIFFSAWMTTIIACGMALAEVESGLPSQAGSLRNPLLGVLAMCALFASMLVNIPRDTFYEYKRAHAVQSDENDFRAAVQLLRSRPGPALCESLLLCYEAGKPYDFDPYFVRDQISMGHLHESDIIEPLRAHRFQTVQIHLNPEDQVLIASESLAFRNNGYFTPAETRELLDNYQLAMRTPTMLIFVPKG
jgi:hypothetical protein